MNWSLILVQLLASLFIVLAAKFASLFMYESAMRAFEEGGLKSMNQHIRNALDHDSSRRVLEWYYFRAPKIGIAVSFVISLAANIRYRQEWINAVAVAFLCYLIYSLRLVEMMSGISASELLGQTYFRLAIIVNVLWLSTSACFLFFGKWTKRYLRSVQHNDPSPLEEATVLEPYQIRDVRCPRCYTMNFDTDPTCPSCGKRL